MESFSCVARIYRLTFDLRTSTIMALTGSPVDAVVLPVVSPLLHVSTEGWVWQIPTKIHATNTLMHPLSRAVAERFSDALREMRTPRKAQI